MKRLLISSASVVALLASVTLVAAQGPAGGGAGDPGGGPAVGAGGDPGGGPASGGPGAGAGESMGSPEQGGPSGGRGESGMSNEAPPSKGAATKSDDAGSPKSSTAEKGDLKDQDQDAGTKRATKEDQESKKGTSAGVESKGSDRSAAEGKSTGEAGSGEVQLSGEQRTQVQKAFAGHKSSAKVDLNIRVAVGVGIPRHVHLVVIPDDILVIVPAWRRYRYIVVDDVICIVDPDTFVIVEVIQLA